MKENYEDRVSSLKEAASEAINSRLYGIGYLKKIKSLDIGISDQAALRDSMHQAITYVIQLRKAIMGNVVSVSPSNDNLQCSICFYAKDEELARQSEEGIRALGELAGHEMLNAIKTTP